jgi:hypothetical protein
MSNRPPRPRIKPNTERLTPIVDPDEYVQNLCSPNTKKADDGDFRVDYEICFDKHYIYHKGVRQFIDSDSVKLIIKEALPYMMLFSSVIKNFSFLNKHPFIGNPNRVLIKKDTPNGLLNVIIQAHFKENLTLEITVITAMCVEDFRLAEGQYAIELLENEAHLLKWEGNIFKRIKLFD